MSYIRKLGREGTRYAVEYTRGCFFLVLISVFLIIFLYLGGSIVKELFSTAPPKYLSFYVYDEEGVDITGRFYSIEIDSSKSDYHEDELRERITKEGYTIVKVEKKEQNIISGDYLRIIFYVKPSK